MEREVEKFLVYLEETKKKSENTRVSYQRDLNKLIRHLREKNIVKVEQISVTHLESFILHMEQQGFAAATISRMIASIKAFYRYLVKQGVVQEDCAENLKGPRVEKKEKKEELSSDEVFRLLEQPAKDTYKGIRDRAMLELLYATGIRVSDLINLKMSDINQKIGCVTCRQQTFDYGRETQRALAKYISKARKSIMKKGESDVLFVNCSGTVMSRQGFWKILKAYAKEAGITTDITTSMIRKNT